MNNKIMNNQEIVKQINELREQQYILRDKEQALEYQIMDLRKSLIPIPKNSYYTNNKGLFCKIYDFRDEKVYILVINIEDKYIAEEVEDIVDFNDIYKKECSKEEYNKALDIIISHFKE